MNKKHLEALRRLAATHTNISQAADSQFYRLVDKVHATFQEVYLSYLADLLLKTDSWLDTAPRDIVGPMHVDICHALGVSKAASSSLPNNFFPLDMTLNDTGMFAFRGGPFQNVAAEDVGTPPYDWPTTPIHRSALGFGYNSLSDILSVVERRESHFAFHPRTTSVSRLRVSQRETEFGDELGFSIDYTRRFSYHGVDDQGVSKAFPFCSVITLEFSSPSALLSERVKNTLLRQLGPNPDKTRHIVNTIFSIIPQFFRLDYYVPLILGDDLPIMNKEKLGERGRRADFHWPMTDSMVNVVALGSDDVRNVVRCERRRGLHNIAVTDLRLWGMAYSTFAATGDSRARMDEWAAHTPSAIRKLLPPSVEIAAPKLLICMDVYTPDGTTNATLFEQPSPTCLVFSHTAFLAKLRDSDGPYQPQRTLHSQFHQARTHRLRDELADKLNDHNGNFIGRIRYVTDIGYDPAETRAYNPHFSPGAYYRSLISVDVIVLPDSAFSDLSMDPLAQGRRVLPNQVQCHEDRGPDFNPFYRNRRSTAVYERATDLLPSSIDFDHATPVLRLHRGPTNVSDTAVFAEFLKPDFTHPHLDQWTELLRNRLGEVATLGMSFCPIFGRHIDGTTDASWFLQANGFQYEIPVRVVVSDHDGLVTHGAPSPGKIMSHDSVDGRYMRSGLLTFSSDPVTLVAGPAYVEAESAFAIDHPLLQHVKITLAYKHLDDVPAEET